MLGKLCSVFEKRTLTLLSLNWISIRDILFKVISAKEIGTELMI